MFTVDRLLVAALLPIIGIPLEQPVIPDRLLGLVLFIAVAMLSRSGVGPAATKPSRAGPDRSLVLCS